jgi:hypothetical protein
MLINRILNHTDLALGGGDPEKNRTDKSLVPTVSKTQRMCDGALEGKRPLQEVERKISRP